MEVQRRRISYLLGEGGEVGKHSLIVVFRGELHRETGAEEAHVVARQLAEDGEVSRRHLHEDRELRHDEHGVVVEHGGAQHMPGV